MAENNQSQMVLRIFYFWCIYHLGPTINLPPGFLSLRKEEPLPELEDNGMEYYLGLGLRPWYLSVFYVKAELRNFGEVRSHPPAPPLATPLIIYSRRCMSVFHEFFSRIQLLVTSNVFVNQTVVATGKLCGCSPIKLCESDLHQLAIAADDISGTRRWLMVRHPMLCKYAPARVLNRNPFTKILFVNWLNTHVRFCFCWHRPN